MIGKLIIAALMAVPVGFLGCGASQAWEQDAKVRSFVPVDAKVLARGMEKKTSRTRRGGTTTRYYPWVRYQYTVDGHGYVSDRVYPYTEGGSADWAQSAIAPYREGQPCEAFYDRADPQQAFLVRHYSFTPYMLLCIGATALATVLGTLVLGQSQKRDPRPRADRWFELFPSSTVATRQRRWMVLTCGWGLAFLVSHGHYLFFADKPYETFALITGGLLLAAVAVGAIVSVYYWRLARTVADARLLVSAWPARLGHELVIRIEQMYLGAVVVQDLSASLICERKTVTGSGKRRKTHIDRLHDDVAALLENVSQSPSQQIQAVHRFEIPGHLPASSVGPENPSHRWRIAVKAKLADCPDYRAEFALLVEE
jgi:hypothetical protein